MNTLVYLINAGNDEKYRQGVVHGTSFPPLGVISLGTAVQHEKGLDVKVFDGLVTDEQTIVDSLRRDRPFVVGVSVLATSYQAALRLARVSKEVGAVTIFGNDQAAITGRNMLRLRKEIDYVCTADIGETSFIQFLEYLQGEREVHDVARLMYRSGEDIQHNNPPQQKILDPFNFLDQIPIPNRLLLSQEDRDRYLDNYRRSYSDEAVTGTSTINRFRGCARVKDACTYCGIADLTIRASSPSVFWEDVRAARDIGVNRLFEAGDSVSSVPGYLEKLLAAKPADLDWNSFIYTSARETTSKLVALYKQLGVFRVNMGLDSGDNTMLQRLKGLRDSIQQSRYAVQLLHDAGIKIYASFVLGGPGETKKSLENTVTFTRWLIDNGLVDGTEAQPLFPELNAKSGKLLLHPDDAQRKAAEQGWTIQDLSLLREMPSKWENHENPDPIAISQDWAAIFSEVPYEDLLSVATEIRNYSKKKGVLTGSSWIVRED